MPDRIDEFEFIGLHGDPAMLDEQLQVIARAGVDGHAIAKLGKRGQPFSLRSAVDVIDIDDGRDALAAYKELIEQDPVEIVWAGRDLSAEGWLCKVLAVRQVRLVPVIRSTGRIYATADPCAWLVCQWDLLPIREEDVEE
jgi:hypothetical protein